MPSENQRVVLVTGASSGIGRACAAYLAGRGFRVYGTSRRAVCNGDGILPGQVSMIPMEVTDDASVERVVNTICSREGRLDIVVNNAGAGIAGPIEKTSIDDARRQLEVNFFGVFRVCRAVLPVMRRQQEGYIINIGSIGGVIALPYQGVYSASKFALEGLSEALRLEVGSWGIRVVIIQPGDHSTAFTDNRRLTDGSGEDEVYRHSFHAALTRVTEDERHGPGPEQVARLLYRIVQSRRPRLRYTVGLPAQRTAAWLKRLLPYSLIERGIRIYYKLND